VKMHYEFGTNPMKMSFKHKSRMKFNHRIKGYIYIYIYSSCKFMIFDEFFFSMGFLHLGMHFSFFFHYVLHSFKVLHNK